ncbi:NAD-dependent deacetylase sirtuin-4 [Venturia nashicola]|uniref:NAD-dependent deacetylase sirtuin-4 n=1 Tax=Venturia nashicola TaxID=86259 RepID=A0A4Z1P0U1_9PEZI|nr:NAD-dependent deacetylase sirtuin-4 [Venturia nashicola]
MGVIRIPYTDPLPPPRIIPAYANTVSGAIKALSQFLLEKPRRPGTDRRDGGDTLLLTGAGISVASGLADYRGSNGTYTLNKTYRPIYYHEFCHSHQARKSHSYPRSEFQKELSRLNPTWHEFLQEMLASGALTTEDPQERRMKGLRTNPDGDVDVPNADYQTFRYPACPKCLASPPEKGWNKEDKGHVQVDKDGAWIPPSNVGMLKPAVIMFGESIPTAIKEAAEIAVDSANRILVIGSSLATYSAWRLVKRAKERKMPIGILNLGGVRGEEAFFKDMGDTGEAVRISEYADKVLPEVIKIVEETRRFEERRTAATNKQSSL